MNLVAISPLWSVSAFVLSLLKGTEPLDLYDESTSPNWGQRYYQRQHRDSQMLHKSWSIIWDGYIKDNTAWNIIYTIVLWSMYCLYEISLELLQVLFTHPQPCKPSNRKTSVTLKFSFASISSKLWDHFSPLEFLCFISRVDLNTASSSRNLQIGTKC